MSETAVQLRFLCSWARLHSSTPGSIECCQVCCVCVLLLLPALIVRKSVYFHSVFGQEPFFLRFGLVFSLVSSFMHLYPYKDKNHFLTLLVSLDLFAIRMFRFASFICLGTPYLCSTNIFLFIHHQLTQTHYSVYSFEDIFYSLSLLASIVVNALTPFWHTEDIE